MRRLMLLGHAACLTAGTLLFAWPALLNRGPILFPDTAAYVRGADAAVVAMTGRTSVWSDRLKLTPPPANGRDGVAKSGSQSRQSVRPTRPVLLGRSVYFGAYLYAALALLGGLGTVLLTSLFSTSVIMVSVSPFGRGLRWGGFALSVGVIAVIGLLTPFPFFVSRLMPDFLTGLLLLSFSSLLVAWSRHGTAARLLLFATCIIAAISHTSHALLLVPLTLAGVLFAGGKSGTRPKAMLLGGAVLLTSMMAHLLFQRAVVATIGHPAISPPFVSARLIADGPGYRELKEGCPASGWALCQLMSAMPQPSDSLLWSADARLGIFMSADRDTMRRLSEQDLQFAFAVTRHRPLEVLASTLRSIGSQISMFELEGINYSVEELDGYRANLPPAVASALMKTRAAHGNLPTGPTVGATVVVTIAALVVIALAFVRVAGNRRSLRPSVRLTAILLVGLAANASIAGALSTPHGRYQMRAIWVLPVASLIIVSRRDRKARSVKMTPMAV